MPRQKRMFIHPTFELTLGLNMAMHMFSCTTKLKEVLVREFHHFVSRSSNALSRIKVRDQEHSP